MPEAKHLTTREVARLCRVSDATVKRWEEAGEIKSERTSGGHRRFRAEEVARFQRKLGLKHGQNCKAVLKANSAFSRRRPIQKHCSGSPFFLSLIEGREDEAADILINAYLDNKSLAEIFDETLCPAMRKIGELWVCGELSVAREHLATRTVINAVQNFRGVLPIQDITGEVALCCAFEGDLHELPPLLVQLSLENEGYEVINFGANMPLYSLVEEVGNYAPNVICISATMIPDIERVARDYKDFRERIAKLKIPIVLGGKALADEQLRQRFPADLYAENFTQLTEFAKEIADGNRI